MSSKNKVSVRARSSRAASRSNIKRNALPKSEKGQRVLTEIDLKLFETIEQGLMAANSEFQLRKVGFQMLGIIKGLLLKPVPASNAVN